MVTTGLAADQLPPAGPGPGTMTEQGRLYRDVAFARPIGYRPLLLDLLVPDADAACPVVVCIYGGGFAMGSHKTDPLGNYLTERLVAEGFAVARPQYRHSREAAFPAPLFDVKAAVRWLRRYASPLCLDAERISAWGGSSGGHLSTMLAVTGDQPEMEGAVGFSGLSSSIRAAVSWSAPVNIARLPEAPVDSPFHQMGVNPHDWLIGGPVGKYPERAKVASTSTHVTAVASPLMVIHGDADNGIPIDQAEELVAAYRSAGAHVEFTRIPGAGHFFDDRTRAAQVTAGILFLRNC